MTAEYCQELTSRIFHANNFHRKLWIHAGVCDVLNSVPRILLAGAGSGCGKTTMTCAILQALTDRGVDTIAFKCGPDYIDPMFHRRITASGGNLDPFFFPPDTLNYLLDKYGGSHAVSVIEGVMGYYDGLGLSEEASTSTVARSTGTPVVLVLNAKGASRSLLAELEGFLRFLPDSGIRGVVFNRCSPSLYPLLADAVTEHFGEEVKPLGYLPPMPDCSLESRHLGLVTAAEVLDLEEKLHALSVQAEKSLDLDGMIALGNSAPPVAYTVPRLPEKREKVRIAVARDNAFCFYYEESLDLLREMGAELVSFSPLRDKALPEGIHGLYLGGGYPELYAEELSRNASMLSAVREALNAGLPTIAECGGFMYLTEAVAEKPMVGFLPGTCHDTGKLTRFGYVNLAAKEDNLLCKAGESIPAHEFHHWDCTDPGDRFTAAKPSGRSWVCAKAGKRLYAGFPHFHFLANPSFAENFYDTCLEVKRGHA